MNVLLTGMRISYSLTTLCFTKSIALWYSSKLDGTIPFDNFPYHVSDYVGKLSQTWRVAMGQVVPVLAGLVVPWNILPHEGSTYPIYRIPKHLCMKHISRYVWVCVRVCDYIDLNAWVAKTQMNIKCSMYLTLKH